MKKLSADTAFRARDPEGAEGGPAEGRRPGAGRKAGGARTK
ncbi:MAG: hypothetical protein U5P10_17060 [Spirochaetia bacterium]|nr:hypothetical protein [Spirochaetia bacterium]